MTQAHQWEEQAYEHLNVGVQLRKIAQMRLALMTRSIAYIDRKFNGGDNDDDFPEYALNMRLAVPTEELIDITNVIDKAIKIERVVTCANLHDINVLAQAAHHNGYRLVPKKDIGKNDTTTEAGVSSETVNAMRVALAGEMF